MLADAFEKFRNNSLKTYELYPSHFLSAPTLRCDAMLNMNLFQILACIYSLKKVWEVEFLMFLRDTVKPAIGTWNLLTEN